GASRGHCMALVTLAGVPWDRAVRDGFGVAASSSTRSLADSVLAKGGREDAWNGEIGAAAEGFLCSLAERLGELLLKDDKRVDVAGRAKTEAREAIYGVSPIDAPAVLRAIAPWTHLPAGTIGDLHRACRPLLATASALTALVGGSRPPLLGWGRADSVDG